MRAPLRLLVAGSAGVAMAGAFEPLAQPLLLPLAVAAATACFVGSSPRLAALVGWAFGVGFMAVLLRWLGPSIGTDAWIALTVIQALWFGLAGVGVRLVSRSRWWPVWAAAVWTAVEVLRQAWPFGGFPWGRLGHAVVDSPWQDVLPYLGVTGTSFVLALLGTVLVWVGQRPKPRRGLVLGGVVALSVLPGVLPRSLESTGSMSVAVVQGGVPGAGNQVAANAAQVTRNHVEATRRLAADVAAGLMPPPDLVVWPENSTASDPFGQDAVGDGIATATQALGDTPLLVGALVDAPRPENLLNQGVVWTQDGPTASRYTKNHPVPFGEYIPYRSLLGPLTGREELVPRDMLPGTGSTPLQAAGVPFADAICFDIAYDDVIGPQVRAGAQFAVVQTSNASFIGTDQLAQQFAITRARALETGRSIVVASLNGISGVIGPDGRVQVQVSERSTEVFVADVSLSTSLTPAVRAGTLPAYVVLVVAGIGLATSAGGRLLSRRRSGLGSAAG